MKYTYTIFKATALISLLICVLSILSCKKESNSNNNNNTSSVSISYTGSLLLNDTVYFSSTAPSNTSTYLWKFGDGTTSTLASPTHVYTSIPFTYDEYAEPLVITYIPDTVTLILNSDTLHPILKSMQLRPQSPPLTNIVGTHTWKHYIDQTNSPQYIPLPDTTFTIVSIDSFRLQVLGDTLTYVPGSQSWYIFPSEQWHFQTELAPYWYAFIALAYSSPLDSLTIITHSGHALGGYYSEYYVAH